MAKVTLLTPDCLGTLLLILTVKLAPSPLNWILCLAPEVIFIINSLPKHKVLWPSEAMSFMTRLCAPWSHISYPYLRCIRVTLFLCKGKQQRCYFGSILKRLVSSSYTYENDSFLKTEFLLVKMPYFTRLIIPLLCFYHTHPGWGGSLECISQNMIIFRNLPYDSRTLDFCLNPLI